MYWYCEHARRARTYLVRGIAYRRERGDAARAKYRYAVGTRGDAGTRTPARDVNIGYAVQFM